MRPAIPLCAALSILGGSVPAPAGSQRYDPTTQSPLTLLRAPKDPLAYLDARKRASALMAEGKAAEAEPLAEQIAREYPRDGENWLLLGHVKRALKKYP